METFLADVNCSFNTDVEGGSHAATLAWIFLLFSFRLMLYNGILVFRKTGMWDVEPVEAELALQHSLAIIIVLLVAVTEAVEVVVVVHVQLVLVIFLRTQGALFEELWIPTIAAHWAFAMEEEDIVVLVAVERTSNAESSLHGLRIITGSVGSPYFWMRSFLRWSGISSRCSL